MCFNKETSLAAFTISILCTIYIYYRGIKNHNNKDIIAATILLLISSMQLIEYFLWKNQTKNIMNNIFSFLIIILLSIQVIICYAMSYYYYSDALTKNQKIFNNSLYIIFIIISLIIIKICYENMNKIYSFADKNTCRLLWGPIKYLDNNMILKYIFIILYFYLGFIVFRNQNYYIIKLLFIFLIIAGIYTFYLKGFDFLSIFGSVWCFLCVFYGIFIILN